MEKLKKLIEKLVCELDDAVDFMDTFSEYPDESFGEEGYERVQNKKDLMEQANQVLTELNK